ncbi:MAG: ABC transporter ATP-binding protein, partial [Clostridiales bacterium]|nr:ABC transporter ATP-binding protein [Clostridiales bacterium]
MKINAEIRRLFKPFRFLQFVNIILAAVQILSQIYCAFLLSKLMEALGSQKKEAVFFNILLILIFGCVAVLADTLSGYYWKKLLFSSTAHLRSILFSKILKKPSAFFSQHSKGELLSILDSDANLVAQSASISSLMLFLNGFHIVMVLIFISLLNWRLMLFSVAVILLYSITFNILNSKIRKSSKEEREKNSELSKEVEEKLDAISLIKIHGKEQYMHTAYDDLLCAHLLKRKKLFRIVSFGEGLNSFISNFFPLIVILFCVFLIAKGYAT